MKYEDALGRPIEDLEDASMAVAGFDYAKQDFEPAWREMHKNLEWIQGNQALGRYLGWNLAAVATDLIKRAYPGLVDGELVELPDLQFGGPRI